MGPPGALDRHAAKVTKQTINHKRIYPPRTGKREDILAAARHKPRNGLPLGRSGPLCGG